MFLNFHFCRDNQNKLLRGSNFKTWFFYDKKLSRWTGVEREQKQERAVIVKTKREGPLWFGNGENF